MFVSHALPNLVFGKTIAAANYQLKSLAGEARLELATPGFGDR
jgi:hypothetical protein